MMTAVLLFGLSNADACSVWPIDEPVLADQKQLPCSEEVTVLLRDARGREIRREQTTSTTEAALGRPTVSRSGTFVLAREYDPDGTVRLGGMAPGEVGTERWQFRDGRMVERVSGSERQTYEFQGDRLVSLTRWSGTEANGTKSFVYGPEGRLAGTSLELRGDGSTVMRSDYHYACG